MYRDERPYEKCEQYGAENLTDGELLAVLLRTGTKGANSLELAQKLLHPDFSECGILNIHRWTREDLLRVKGIGRVKAVQILCLSELAKRLSKASAASGLNFSSPDTIAQYYMESLRHEEQENVRCMMLDTKNHFLGDIALTRERLIRLLYHPESFSWRHLLFMRYI